MNHPRPGSHRSPCLAALLLILPLGAGPVTGQVATAASADPIAVLGLRETTGAAPGYLADRACRLCHTDVWESYQGSGMGRSMRRPTPDAMIEELGAELVHAPSGEHYRVDWRDGELRFRRWQLDGGGAEVNVFDCAIDWIVGSGGRSRVYLYGDPAGELFQLPIAWYTEEAKWGMAPGFDRPGHPGVGREVRRECAFCHNAYPEVPAASDRRWEPDLFPLELPEGIGCQRCHGPGAQHVRSVLTGESEGEARRSIVNPALLEPERRDAVCFQCHYQPSVALSRPRRFGRGDYSFRPGEPLTDYLLPVDAVDAERQQDERFEINHAGYRLAQSPCFEGGLTCIDCHDPHQPLGRDPRLANLASVCLRCHQPHATPPGPGVTGSRGCAACHMPRRRTQDVVQVVMTDHRIQRVPPADALAPIAESDPAVVGVSLPRRGAPTGSLGEVYRAVTALRAAPTSTTGLEHLVEHLEAARIASPVPRLELLSGLLAQRMYRQAEAVLDSWDEATWSPLLDSWRGIVAAGLGDLEGSIGHHRRAISGADLPEHHYNLGVVLKAAGDHQSAVEHLGRAVALRPTFARAWLVRADALAADGRFADAAADYRRALSIEPRSERAYEGLARALRATGDAAGAERWWRHGQRVARPPGGLAAELAPGGP